MVYFNSFILFDFTFPVLHFYFTTASLLSPILFTFIRDLLCFVCFARHSKESQKEMKLLLDMYKEVSKETREISEVIKYIFFLLENRHFGRWDVWELVHFPR